MSFDLQACAQCGLYICMYLASYLTVSTNFSAGSSTIALCVFFVAYSTECKIRLLSKIINFELISDAHVQQQLRFHFAL